MGTGSNLTSAVTKKLRLRPRVIIPTDLRSRTGPSTVSSGPSACGKSTMLRMIAGLEKITLRARIEIDVISWSTTCPGQAGHLDGVPVLCAYSRYVGLRKTSPFPAPLFAPGPVPASYALVAKAAAVLKLETSAPPPRRAFPAARTVHGFAISAGPSSANPSVFLLDRTGRRTHCRLARRDCFVDDCPRPCQGRLANVMIYVPQ